jgi:hypothetical protein
MKQRIKKVLFLFRIGTCGGIGLPPGTVVVTDEAFDGLLRPVLDTVSSLFDFVFGPQIARTLRKPTFISPSGNWTIPYRPSALHCLNFRGNQFSFIRKNCLQNIQK